MSGALNHVVVSQPFPINDPPHFARSIRVNLEARKLAEDPVRERFATLGAFVIIGVYPGGMVRKENLALFEELEAEIGEQ